MKKSGIKFLCFIFSVVLVLTAVGIPAVINTFAVSEVNTVKLMKNYLAGALKTPAANVNAVTFEDGLPEGTFESNTYLEGTAKTVTAGVSDNFAHSGKYSYQIHTYDLSWTSVYIDVGNVTSGKQYVLDYYWYVNPDETYYSDSHQGDFYISVNAAEKGNYWATSKKLAGDIKTTKCWEIIHATANKKWRHASYTFTATATNDCFLTVNTESAICLGIYIDDITLTEVTGSKAVTTFHNVYSSWQNQTSDIIMAGETGESIDYAPACTGREIVGWFSDSALTKPVTKYSKDTPDLYPLWATVIDFNNYPYKIRPEADSHDYFGGDLDITDKKGSGYDDDRALRINLDQSKYYVTCQNPSCLQKFTYSGDMERDMPLGEKCPYCGTVFTDEKTDDGKYKIGPTQWKDRCSWANPEHSAPVSGIEADSDYLVSYYVKVDDITCEHTIRLFTGWDKNVWSGASFMTTGNHVLYVSDKGKGWKQFSAIVHTPSELSYKNSLFINFIPVGVTSVGRIDAYVDNISVTKITAGQKYVLLSANADGSAESAFIMAAPGDSINLSALTPKKGKAALKYWSTDAEGKNKTELPTVMPEESKIYYANWGVDPITFDDKYTVDTSDNSVFGKNFKLVSGGYDDNFALRADYQGDKVESYNPDGTVKQYSKDRAKGLDTVALLKTVQNHTAYKVSYRYKILGTNVNIAFSLSSCWNQNIWSGGAYNGNDEATRISEDKSCDWKEVTTYVYIEIPKVCANENCKKAVSGEADVCPHCGYKFTGEETVPYYYGSYGLFFQVNPTTDRKDGRYSVLFDDFYIEETTEPLVMYNPTKLSENDHASGEAVVGSAVKNPAMTYFGRVLEGFYLDSAYTKPFNAKSVDKPTLVYAKWGEADSRIYDFEQWYLRPEEPDPHYYCTRVDSRQVEFSKARSGNHVIAFDREMDKITNMGGCVFGVARENDICKVKLERTYLIEVWVYKARQSSSDLNVYPTVAMNTNCYSYSNATYNTEQVKTSSPVGQWQKLSFYIDTHNPNKTYADSLYIVANNGYDGLFYFDDLTVTLLPEDESVVYVKNAGTVPQIAVGKIGSDFRNLLPKSPKMENNIFLGYCEEALDDEGKYVPCTAFTLTAVPLRIQAHWRKIKVGQSFEEDFIQRYNYFGTMSIMDMDYEIYDGSKTGNTSENVTKGKYSLHRKGESMYKENVALLSLEDQIESGAKYTVSFDIKMDKYLQTDGAVKIASGMSANYPYTTMGDYYPVIAVKDLTDGNWHTVKYTFNSIQPFVSLQTPGYCSIYIDNVIIELADDSAVTSVPVTFTEYVPAPRDKDGNLLNKDTFAFIDVESIVDESLYSKSAVDTVKDNIIWFIVGGGVILLAAAGTVTVLLLKKKKSGKAGK